VNEKKYVIAMDQGTTSSRCILFDQKGEVRGAEAVIALLKDVEAALTEESCYFAYPAHLTEGGEGLPYGRGKACLVLAQGGPDRYVALCFLEMDSVGRIRGVHLSGDGRYGFEIDC